MSFKALAPSTFKEGRCESLTNCTVSQLQNLREPILYIRPPSLLTPNACLRGFQNCPQVWKFARSTHRTQWKLSYSWLQFITGKRSWLKSAKESSYIRLGLRLEEPTTELLSPCPVESEHVIIPALACDSMHGALPTREAHWAFGGQSFYWDLITYCSRGWPLVSSPSWTSVLGWYL